MNRTADRLAMISELETANERDRYDLEQRRGARELRGEFFDNSNDDNIIIKPERIVCKQLAEQSTPQQPDDIMALISANNEMLADLVGEHTAEIIAPLLERIATLETILDQRSASWLDGMRGQQRK